MITKEENGIKVVFFSLTGNTRRFIEKLGMDSLEIEPMNPFITIDTPYVIIAPTYDIEATECINDFIENNDIELFKGVIGGGNRNFADLYCFTAKDIANDYNIPLLYTFEYSGTDEDVENVTKIIKEIE